MNDLVGLKYGWGHRPGDGSGRTDCFQLVCEVRDRLGLSSYREQFAWVYSGWTEETFPRRMLARWLLEHGRRLQLPQTGAVALMPGNAGGALGTFVNDRTMFIGPGQAVIQASVPLQAARFFWMVR